MFLTMAEIFITLRVCQIELLVTYGEKSFKSIQIVQIFFLFVICLICNDLWDFCAKRTPLLSRLRREPVVDVQSALNHFDTPSLEYQDL